MKFLPSVWRDLPNSNSSKSVWSEITPEPCLLTGNTVLSFPDRYARRGDYLNELFDELHGKIRGGHLKDVHLSEKGFSITGTLTEAVAGDGELDWETYLYRLDGELGKDEPAALEHLKEKDIPRAKKFIEDVSSKIGVNWTI